MKTKTSKKSVWLTKQAIPNWLTIARIVLIPIIVIFILISQNSNLSFNLIKPLYQISIDNQTIININGCFLTTAIFFILASITDAIDGFLARKFNWVSDFGKLWDPLADKLLTNAVLICFGAMKYLPIWLVLIFVIRDIIIDGYRMLAMKSQIVVPANIFGKIKTIFIMVGIVFIFFLGTNFDTTWYYWAINNLLMYCGAVLSVGSGILYMIQISKLISDKKNDQEVEENESKCNN